MVPNPRPFGADTGGPSRSVQLIRRGPPDQAVLMNVDEHLFRREAGRLTAALTRAFGVHNLALAEEAEAIRELIETGTVFRDQSRVGGVAGVGAPPAKAV